MVGEKKKKHLEKKTRVEISTFQKQGYAESKLQNTYIVAL